MRSLGSRPAGARLERMRASALWAGEGFRNVHPVIPGLRDPRASMPTVTEFLALLGGGPFLPVHWGTFSLAMHAWDQPVERLLDLGPKAGAQLVMPRLGEPVEPSHTEDVEPWWRAVDASASTARSRGSAATLPQSMPWPID